VFHRLARGATRQAHPMLDAQLKAEVVSINHGATIRLDAVECPHVADVLEQGFALCGPGGAKCQTRAGS
jgi:hypothetical protein